MKLLKIVKCDDNRLFRFIGDDFIFYKSTPIGLFYFENSTNRINLFIYPEDKKYHLVQLDDKKRLILGLSDEKPNITDLSSFNFYCVKLKNNSAEKIINPFDKNNKMGFSADEVLKNIHYDSSYAYAKSGDYYLIAKDVLNHGIEYNLVNPEKHAYHDMDLCLVDKNGIVCAVLPFTVDDQVVAKLDILESSPDEKLLKIKASGSYFFAKINDSLLEKYPELKKGLYYFIYEISSEQAVKDIEYIDLSSELNLEEGKKIDVKYENKNYSGFDVKIKEDSIENALKEQKKTKSLWWLE